MRLASMTATELAQPPDQLVLVALADPSLALELSAALVVPVDSCEFSLDYYP